MPQQLSPSAADSHSGLSHVILEIVISGTVESFVASDFVASLANYLGASPSGITLDIGGGSVAIVTTISFTTRRAAQEAATTLESASTSALSRALGVEVEAVSLVSVTQLFGAPSPSAWTQTPPSAPPGVSHPLAPLSSHAGSEMLSTDTDVTLDSPNQVGSALRPILAAVGVLGICMVMGMVWLAYLCFHPAALEAMQKNRDAVKSWITPGSRVGITYRSTDEPLPKTQTQLEPDVRM